LALRETSNYPDEKINKIVSRIAEDEDELAAEAAETLQRTSFHTRAEKYSAIQEARIQQERQRSNDGAKNTSSLFCNSIPHKLFIHNEEIK
jgi:hypothetical protein